MNVIHIIMDTLKRSYLEPYGSKWCKTPNLQRFAEKSVVFERAYCASFPCMPARRDFMTGNFEFPFRGWGPLEESDRTITQILKDSKTVTGLVTDHYHLFREGSGNYHFDFTAWDFIRGIEGDRVYSDPEDELDIVFQCVPERIAENHRKYYLKYKHIKMQNPEDWFSPRTFKSASEWVERNKGHKSFYLMIDSFPPHEPFDPPPGYAEMYDKDYKGDRLITPVYKPWPGHYSENEIQNIKALYAGNITHVDKWFGSFIDRLEKQGLLENTMIIVTTDHGTYTGDHGWTGKLGTYLYDCICHIPAIIYHPEIAPRKETAIVQNTDIVPTILEALGVRHDIKMHGSSIMPVLRKEKEKIHDYAHSGFFGRQHIINDGKYALHLGHDMSKPLYWYGYANSYFVGVGSLCPVENGRRKVNTAEKIQKQKRYPDEPALFDLEADPDQHINLIDSALDVKKRFIKELERWCIEINAPQEYIERLIV
ncbi:MAG: hypothetical protein A2096_08455 [Spirochaetes bacterium GWF1_41_5]|nr:MAG: hypothetical protein A2096_08455 [Spirochaetes bacterium GWF1_41_5]HBE02580.1 hypothetical protein [Spirochaetia bacterium]